MKCKKCNNNFEPIKGLVQYCSKKCRDGRIWSDKDKEKKSTAAKAYMDNKPKKEKNIIAYICEKCDDPFEDIRIHNKRKKHCKKCRRNVVRLKEGDSILDYSSRTISKIIKRAKIGCQICNYDKTTMDIHHIIFKKNGGTDDNDNLIILCPNCHREAHEGLIDIKKLQEKTITKIFSNYKEFYNT